MTATFRFFKQEIRASLAEIDGLCLGLRDFLVEGQALCRRDRFAIELLAREALSNSVRHGCKEDRSKRVSFECRLGSQWAILKVADEGPGFDWASSLSRSPDEEASHGRGLALFRQYASRILFNQCGNRILLIRNFSEPIMHENEVSVEGTSALLRPGDLTAATVDRVREKLKGLLQGGITEITFDLAGVQMVDSMGIGLLIQTNNSLSKVSGCLVVKNASGDLMELFRSMRLDKRFTLQD